MKQTVAVLDDEPDILELVSLHLERAGFDVLRFDRAAPFVSLLREGRVPDLLVLDLMLPDMHGTEVCGFIRSNPAIAGLPIIMLTALADEPDRVTGLETGADDYVTKPFSPRELVARVQAVLRRSSGPQREDGAIEVGCLVLHPDSYRTEVRGLPVDLTTTEFRILLMLAGSPGRVFSRALILENLWEGEK